MANFDRLEIAKKLQSFHYFFRAFWDIGNPIIGPMKKPKTAAISFNREGAAIDLLINEDYWNSLNEHSQLFLICHEMAHVVLQHGKKLVEYERDAEATQRFNVAADIVINEMLCRSFGFVRADLNPSLRDEACWYDTVFKNYPVAHGESTEYYFNLLAQFPDARPKKKGDDMSIAKGDGSCDGECEPSDQEPFEMDEHYLMSEEDNGTVQDIMGRAGVLDDIDEAFLDGLPSDEIADIRSAVGTGAWIKLQKKKVSTKKKWESVIKKWESYLKKDEFFDDDRWERVNPRYSQILSKKTHLPTTAKVLDEKKVNEKIDVCFFLDTSGSCISLAQRFFNAAKSLDPKKFKIRLFCFDTKVKETTLESMKVYGGGGTAFNIMEEKIQSLIKAKELKKYPKAVFVITDGHGNQINPENPKAWYWFLTKSHSTHFIPKTSKIYKLADYD